MFPQRTTVIHTVAKGEDEETVPSVHLATLLSLRAILRPDDYDELIHAALSRVSMRGEGGEGNLLREVISVCVQ